MRLHGRRAGPFVRRLVTCSSRFCVALVQCGTKRRELLVSRLHACLQGTHTVLQNLFPSHRRLPGKAEDRGLGGGCCLCSHELLLGQQARGGEAPTVRCQLRAECRTLFES